MHSLGGMAKKAVHAKPDLSFHNWDRDADNMAAAKRGWVVGNMVCTRGATFEWNVSVTIHADSNSTNFSASIHAYKHMYYEDGNTSWSYCERALTL